MKHKDSLPCSEKHPSVVTILSQINQVHTLKICFFKIYFNSILPFKSRSSKRSLSFSLAEYNFIRISQIPLRATWLVHIKLIYLISPVIFDEVFTSGTKCVVIYVISPPITSSILHSNILQSALMKHRKSTDFETTRGLRCYCTLFMRNKNVNHVTYIQTHRYTLHRYNHAPTAFTAHRQPAYI